MDKKKLMIFCFIIISLIAGNCKIYADQIESNFKNICLIIAKNMSPAGSESELKECKERLKGIVRSNPDSIWANDAQYLILMLSTTDTPQHIAEAEYILKHYPNVHFENLTKETLPMLMPNENIPFEVMVRMELCLDYKELGETEKLKYMCEESIKKYPDRAKVFEKFLQ